MKVGLLTFPFNNNYGGYLQAFALMEVLKREGHDVELINRRFFERKGFLYLKKVKNLLWCWIKGDKYITLRDKENQYYQTAVYTFPFVKKYIQPQTPSFYSTLQMRKWCKNRYDVIVVGSDQVWRAGMLYHIESFFGDFVSFNSKTKIISYAASFGVDAPPYTKSQIRSCGQLIRRFYAISVRESSGVGLIKDVFKWTDNDVKLVLDPTLLLKAESYRKLVSNHLPFNKFIFCYILDKSSEKLQLIESICSRTGFRPYYILPKYAPTNYNANLTDRIMPPIDFFIDGMDRAEYVITDSFHGTAFSVIFKKNFIVFDNENRGNARMQTLLSYVNASNKLISPQTNIRTAMALLMEKVEFDSSMFMKQYQKSIDFIRENIC